ncbi:MAG TPA: HNH endonuclease signature motif containing protein, partial [Methylomirabilota bacterium]|nr:HNH endonuclease signature motif containing protein [Methylomirabilota bacterium]
MKKNTPKNVPSLNVLIHLYYDGYLLDLEKLLGLLYNNTAETDMGCRIWLGSTNSYGYGTVFAFDNNRMVHRIIWELEVGDIPEGWHIHHICKNKLCVNIEHLQPLSPRDHMLIENTPPAVNSRKEYCKYGHKLDEEITAIYGGARQCRVCHIRRAREFRYKNLEQQREYQRVWAANKRAENKAGVI